MKTETTERSLESAVRLGCAAAAGLSRGAVATGAPPAETAIVVRTAEAVILDGKLTEAAWQQAPAHPLSRLDHTANLPERTREAMLADPFEGGSARFLFDDSFLYVGIAFDDRDVVAQIEGDQKHLYQGGDLAEVFIKADAAPGYWELYASPLGNKTSFFFPSPGYVGLPGGFDIPLMDGFNVAASVDGTVNDHRDVDRGWSAEIAIPRAALQASTGVDFAPGQSWRILVSRYNYGYTLRSRQFSSFPELPQVNYHLIEYYAPIRFR